jgi:uncharacterized membrane protein YgaE (UPF0421/DUF939 family)
MFFSHSIVFICIASAIIIMLCNAFDKIDTARCALLTLVGVVLPSYHEPSYIIAVERIVCVTAGLLTALLVNIFYGWLFAKVSLKFDVSGSKEGDSL